ncbi:DUF6443 domain-containing protein [Riemerella anatipestifer]|nr:DUF6443 domain-containing protein [Riemerella anatipestifer]MDY3357290.1 DUF6443 domain-containing protein [Riemerella anatipestifer]
MKRHLFLLFGLFSLGGWAQSLPSTENYIYTKICLSADCVKKSETVQYYDGLGRPKQIVGIKATPKGRDLVTPIEYDAFGRQAKDYLPIPQSGTLGGNIYANPQSNASATYGSEKIYAEKIFENSPLDRVLAQVQVGNDWSNRPINFGYDANTTADAVKKYTTSTTWADGATVSILTLSGVYDNAQLYKNTVTDEDGNTTIEFKNGEGQTLLVRKTDGTQNIDTYYVYNEYNQLAFVIPPLAAAKPSLGTSDLDALCYQYRYDGKNRLVEKKLPGKGWEWMVYDQQDRLVLSQDALQRGKEWFFTKYDALGRVAYTGLFSNTASRVSMQTALSNMNVNRANNERRTDAPFTLNGATVYYTREAFPKSSFKLLSVNYYDTYPADAPAVPTNIMGQETLKPTITNNRSTKGLPTAVYLKNLEDDAWTKTYTYYDTKARPIATHSINHLGGYTKTESLLDFSGVALSQNTTHKRDAGSSEVKVAERLTYDHQNRLLQRYHKVDSGAEELLANHTYDELSRVAVKKVGGSIGAPLQQLDYSYNIRGWLTKLNRPEDLGTDLFGFELRYQNPVASDAKQQPRYNGNIAQMDWVSRQDGQLRRYTYQYDPLNRLRNAYYSKPNATVPITNAYNEYLAYDANGNITTLHRFGGSDQNMAVKIDELTYTYNGNQLINVVDATQNISGYPLGGNTITYDANGNMTSLLDKKISRIGYNTLNLPNQVQSAAGNLSYIYRADGAKLKKEFNTNVIDYLDGFQYEASRLQFFPTAEGYYDYLHKRYVYHYTDHLGNVRLSYYKGSNNLVIDKESNYYPFGLEHTGYNGLLGNQSYNYKYNGKELQIEIGMYDYGARFYIPDLGRWGVVDPLAEKYPSWSPYAYCYNNPIKFIDPTGMEGISTDVRRNKDGSYTVMNAHNDRDTNVYVVDDKGKRTGEIVAQTVNPTDFLYTNEETGGFDGPARGVTFRLDKLPSGDNLIDRLGKQFRDKWDFGTPIIGLARLAKLSANGNELDIKADKKLAPQGEYSVFSYNGGNYAITEGGTPTITTARAIGNILFGQNMRSIYESNKNPGGMTANDFYNFAMPIVGGYNQFQNNRWKYLSGNARNLTGAPFYGEHKYSGTYIYGGYFGNYK